jgi:cytochrome c oxidase cbb3-type subunit III
MKRYSLLFLTSVLAVTMGHAQQTAAPAAAEAGPNFMEFFLAGVAIVLLFVIWGLGNVLITYAKKATENVKKSQAGKTSAIVVGLLLLSAAAMAQDPAAAEPVKAATNYGGVTATTFYLLVGVIGLEFLVIFFLVFNIRRLTAELFPQTEEALTPAAVPVQQEGWLSKTWRELDRKFFTKAAEKEADVLLDHDYDGIRELDNALPPWWKYGFYITIVLAVIYLFRFHVAGSGPNPEQEYAAELKQAEEQMKAYMAKAKDLVDENNVQFEQAGVETGKELYLKACVACHGQKGEGGVGPNLTDDYWIHGGSMNNIFKTIKYGYPDKGMQSWQQQYSPKQMAQISSFIKTLRGTNPPNGKAAQGDLYKEAAGAATDSSAAAKPDSAVAVN